MEIFIATTVAFVLGVVTGVMGLLSIASRNKRKDKNNESNLTITKVETVTIDCWKCDGRREKEGRFVKQCPNCGSKSFFDIRTI